MRIRNLIPYPGESFFEYAKRMKYGVLRRIVPSIREKHRLESMIGPEGYWEKIQKYQFNLMTEMGLKPHHTFMDIGCGPLPGGLVFIPYLQTGHYVGIDIRKESIAEAHIQLAKAGFADRNPFLAVSSTFGQEELGDRKFDYIWASQILYHLSDEMIEACLESVAAHMKPDSRFYGDIIGCPANRIQPDSHWHEFSFFLHSPDFLEALGGKCGLKMTNLGKIEDYGYPSTIGLKTNILLEFRKDLITHDVSETCSESHC